MNPRFTLTLSAPPSEIPPAIRLRGALKALKRRFGLVCIDVREITASDKAIDTQSTDKTISIDMANTCNTSKTDCISVGAEIAPKTLTKLNASECHGGQNQ